MKSWTCYAFAAGLLAFPLTWMLNGWLVAMATESIPSLTARPYYVPGIYALPASVGAVLVVCAVLLVGYGRTRKG